MSISEADKFLLNRMNSTAQKVQMGDLVDQAHGSHKVVGAVKHTTTNNATQAVAIAGVLATDIAIASIQTLGGTPRTLLRATPGAGDVTIEFNDAPGTDHIVSIIVLRLAV